jgi:hypothetical protein
VLAAYASACASSPTAIIFTIIVIIIIIYSARTDIFRLVDLFIVYLFQDHRYLFRQYNRDDDGWHGMAAAGGEKMSETTRQQSRVCISPSSRHTSFHHPHHHPSLARELVVKGREADGKRLQRRHGMLKVHVEAVLADLAELQNDRLGCEEEAETTRVASDMSMVGNL